jgi:hypothetical protein
MGDSCDLSAGRYCLLCPKAGNVGLTALFGSLGVSFGRNGLGSSIKSTQSRIDRLLERYVGFLLLGFIPLGRVQDHVSLSLERPLTQWDRGELFMYLYSTCVGKNHRLLVL